MITFASLLTICAAGLLFGNKVVMASTGPQFSSKDCRSSTSIYDSQTNPAPIGAGVHKNGNSRSTHTTLRGRPIRLAPRYPSTHHRLPLLSFSKDKPSLYGRYEDAVNSEDYQSYLEQKYPVLDVTPAPVAPVLPVPLAPVIPVALVAPAAPAALVAPAAPAALVAPAAPAAPAMLKFPTEPSIYSRMSTAVKSPEFQHYLRTLEPSARVAAGFPENMPVILVEIPEAVALKANGGSALEDGSQEDDSSDMSTTTTSSSSGISDSQ
jgi:hypothetical protein